MRVRQAKSPAPLLRVPTGSTALPRGRHRHQQQPLGRTNWVENTTLVSDGSAQASVTTNLAIGGNQTIAGTQEVTGNSSVTANFAVGGLTTLTGTTTLKNQLVDASGDAYCRRCWINCSRQAPTPP